MHRSSLGRHVQLQPSASYAGGQCGSSAINNSGQFNKCCITAPFRTIRP